MMQPSLHPKPGDTHAVSVIATARLHMGFIDLHGGVGRKFGSIGLSLDNPATMLAVTKHDSFSAEGVLAGRVLDYARQFAAQAGIKGGAHFEVRQAIPEHAGLGSGTQLALAVGSALTRLYQLPVDVREIAAWIGRGMRSGIGVGVFEQGGLVVDGGHGEHTIVPPILARMDFPEHWHILLVLDQSAYGVHGQAEVSAFKELPEFPASSAAHIARLLLMQALPAVAEQDLSAFGSAISEIQQLVGDYFAPAQGGGRYTSSRVASVMQWLQTQGVACLGQSSWGPTGFAVVKNEEEACQLRDKVQQSWSELDCLICRGRNQGAIVTPCV
jgi:beta-ribofuranosylaminobenzene 5'-phosphate synthase